MMVDRDLVVTYANAATHALLGKHRDEMRSTYPGFDPARIVGTCIDIFHQDPAHQRQMLSDPRNLPHSVDIRIGSLQFNINVSAQFDGRGEYVGNTLEWYDVTERREDEGRVARLRSAIDGAATCIMLCDEDLNIVYCNPAVIKLFRDRQEAMRRDFPGFDVDKLVGSNIDQFHKDASHQRRMLSSMRELPFRSEIKIADLEFEVNATAIRGPDGSYAGNMVEWSDITEKKATERAIHRLIDDVSEVMGALAKGDLSQRMADDHTKEFLPICEAVNGCADNLADMVRQIRIASRSITRSTAEISQGNIDLSQRTEEQASNLEETSSAMEELTSTVAQNADNARQADQLSSGARDEAEKGGAVVGRAIEAMANINASSKKISDIIGVIDEIAFQTNLLALNAAVEAARAGEQGRGFAVVATEVRNLAQRSSGAAKEISALIKDSVECVDEGSRLVNESGETLAEIVSSVKKVSDIISEIAAASEEQSAGIEEVSSAITQMDQMTQQNAALVEQAAAASESVKEESARMDELMNFFRLGDGEDEQPVAAALGSSKPAVARSEASRPTPPRAPAAASRRPSPVELANDHEWEEF